MMLAMVMSGHDDFTASNGWLQAWQKRQCQVGGTEWRGRRDSVKWAALSGEAEETQCQVGGTEWRGRRDTVSSGRY